MAEEETFIDVITKVIDELLVSGHPAVIHFPIIGVMMGAVAAMTAFVLAVGLDVFEKRLAKHKEMIERYIDRFEFSSWILVLMGLLSLIVAGWTGIRSAGSLDVAVSQEILSFKVKLSVYAFLLILAPLGLKVFIWLKYNKSIFNGNKVIPVLYILPLLIAALQIMVLSGAGGRYVYGHSILDTLGLSWLFPFAE